MKKNILLTCFTIICLTLSAQYRKFSFQQPKMGSLFSIVIYSTDSASAAKSAAHVYRLIDTLNVIYSDYLPESELNRLCEKSGTGEWVQVSQPLFRIIEVAYQAGKISGGGFDITMGPLVRLWRKARHEKVLPRTDSLLAAKRRVGYRYIEIDKENKAIRLKKRACN